MNDAVAGVRIEPSVERLEQRPIRTNDLRIGIDASYPNHAPHRSNHSKRHEDSLPQESTSLCHPPEPHGHKDCGRAQHEDVIASFDGSQDEKSDSNDEGSHDNGRHLALDGCGSAGRSDLDGPYPETFRQRHRLLVTGAAAAVHLDEL